MAVNTVAAPQQGTNVNDKVHFKNIDIAIDKGHVNKDTGKTEFWATSSDVLKNQKQIIQSMILLKRAIHLLLNMVNISVQDQ